MLGTEIIRDAFNICPKHSKSQAPAGEYSKRHTVDRDTPSGISFASWYCALDDRGCRVGRMWLPKLYQGLLRAQPSARVLNGLAPRPNRETRRITAPRWSF